MKATEHETDSDSSNLSDCDEDYEQEPPNLLSKAISYFNFIKELNAEICKLKNTLVNQIGNKQLAEAEKQVMSEAPYLELSGFDRGLKADKILGVVHSNIGGLYFLVKYKDIQQPELVAASVANLLIPQMVIQFYEERLYWQPTE